MAEQKLELLSEVLTEAELEVAKIVMQICKERGSGAQFTLREVASAANARLSVAHNTLRFLIVASVVKRVRHGVYVCV